MGGFGIPSLPFGLPGRFRRSPTKRPKSLLISRFATSHWVRDQGKVPLAEAIRRMTSAAARVHDLKDRGTLAPAMRADINVLDPERVEERQPTVVRDFPHGKSRLVQRAVGYRATLVNGQVILRDDEHTGNRPGRILRSKV